MKLLIILLCVSATSLGAPPLAQQVVDASPDYIRYLPAARDLLDRVPLIDGHNDFPMTLRDYAKNQVGTLNITDLTNVAPWSTSPLSHTDIKRLRTGKLGAQFWSAYVGCNTQYKDAVARTWEQIDVVHRMVDANPDVFEFVTSTQGIRDAFATGKIGSLIGVEGGHSIGSSLAILRMMYAMGVRYLTMTHSCTTPWGDNSQLDNVGNQPVHDGLSPFGKTVVKEMNRLGMLIDLSHVSRKTMRDSIETSSAPVIFSHSSAFTLCNNTRNVPDDILRLLPDNGGVVMVNFYPAFVTCSSSGTVQDVANHIDHIRNVAGVDHVGIGGDYNGIEKTPTGLEDVSGYPNLFAELLSRGWSDVDLEKLAGGNLLRAFEGAEKVRDQLAAEGVKPYDEWIPSEDLPEEATPCLTFDNPSISVSSKTTLSGLLYAACLLVYLLNP